MAGESFGPPASGYSSGVNLNTLPQSIPGIYDLVTGRTNKMSQAQLDQAQGVATHTGLENQYYPQTIANDTTRAQAGMLGSQAGMLNANVNTRTRMRSIVPTGLPSYEESTASRIVTTAKDPSHIFLRTHGTSSRLRISSGPRDVMTSFHNTIRSKLLATSDSWTSDLQRSSDFRLRWYLHGMANSGWRSILTGMVD